MRDGAGAPYRNAVVVITIAITMACLFAISYSIALGRPTPHHVPTAVVGASRSAGTLLATLERSTSQNLSLVPAPSLARAKLAIEQQRVYAAVVLLGPPTLLVASASGVSVARLLEQAAMHPQWPRRR